MLNEITVSSKQLKEILGATHNLDTDYFWNNESGNVFYCDGDKQTCIDNLLEVYTKSIFPCCDLYFCKDSGMYYLVISD